MASFSALDEGPGSFDFVVHRLSRWAQSSVAGIAYVTYESESLRSEAESAWVRNVVANGNAVEFLNLSALNSVISALEFLRSQRENSETEIFSVTGFEAILSSLQSDWTPLNLRREAWFLDGLCQVWWIPQWFDEKFANLAPDLYSWFLVKERLEKPYTYRSDRPQPTESPDEIGFQGTEFYHRESAWLLTHKATQRFNQAKESGATLDRLLKLVKHSIRFLYDAGLGAEGRLIAANLLEQLESDSEEFKNTNPARVFAARVDLAQYLARHDDYELASRVLELHPIDAIDDLSDMKKPAALLILGEVSYYKGDNSAARNYFDQGLIWADKVKDLTSHANILKSLAAVEFSEGGLSKARALCLRALGEFELIGSYLGQADVMSALGTIYLASNPASAAPDQATVSYFTQAYDLYVKANSSKGISRSLQKLASIERALKIPKTQ